MLTRRNVITEKKIKKKQLKERGEEIRKNSKIAREQVNDILAMRMQ
jgi:hypothetical protein